ncbi:MAG: hypothetical protein ACE5MK_00495 [Acidobacteriota bacterium]
MNRFSATGLVTALAIVAVWATQAQPITPTLRYAGSSTIAHFIRDVEPVYGQVRFVLDTEPESVGGELAILEGRADLAGVAGHPKPETLVYVEELLRQRK